MDIKLRFIENILFKKSRKVKHLAFISGLSDVKSKMLRKFHHLYLFVLVSVLVPMVTGLLDLLADGLNCTLSVSSLCPSECVNLLKKKKKYYHSS